MLNKEFYIAREEHRVFPIYLLLQKRQLSIKIAKCTPKILHTSIENVIIDVLLKFQVNRSIFVPVIEFGQLGKCTFEKFRSKFSVCSCRAKIDFLNFLQWPNLWKEFAPQNICIDNKCYYKTTINNLYFSSNRANHCKYFYSYLKTTKTTTEQLSVIHMLNPMKVKILCTKSAIFSYQLPLKKSSTVKTLTWSKLK